MDEINRHNMLTAMTMWHDGATWFPFVEDENCYITGPGHQDFADFAGAIIRYDRAMSGNWSEPHSFVGEIKHEWITPEAVNGDVVFMRAKADDPRALPVTTLWGAR